MLWRLSSELSTSSSDRRAQACQVRQEHKSSRISFPSLYTSWLTNGMRTYLVANGFTSWLTKLEEKSLPVSTSRGFTYLLGVHSIFTWQAGQ